MKLLKRKVATYASTNRDRGLLIRGSVKEQKTSKMPGPGSYNTLTIGSIMDSMQKHAK